MNLLHNGEFVLYLKQCVLLAFLGAYDHARAIYVAICNMNRAQFFKTPCTWFHLPATFEISWFCCLHCVRVWPRLLISPRCWNKVGNFHGHWFSVGMWYQFQDTLKVQQGFHSVRNKAVRSILGAYNHVAICNIYDECIFMTWSPRRRVWKMLAFSGVNSHTCCPMFSFLECSTSNMMKLFRHPNP